MFFIESMNTEVGKVLYNFTNFLIISHSRTMINPSGAAPSNNPEPPTANTAVSQYSVEALLAKSDPRIGRCYLLFSF